MNLECRGREYVKSLTYFLCQKKESFNKFNITVEPPPDERNQQIIDNISSAKSGIALPYLQVYLDMLYREDFAKASARPV